jgi:hypothetical protein
MGEFRVMDVTRRRTICHGIRTEGGNKVIVYRFGRESLLVEEEDY